MLLLGVWLGFELWYRPYRSRAVSPVFERCWERILSEAGLERRPRPELPWEVQIRQLAGKEPAKVEELVAAAKREVERLESLAGAADGGAGSCMQKLAWLEESGRALETDRAHGVSLLRERERHWREMEAKALAARNDADKASEEVEREPSAVNALRQGEAQEADGEAAKRAAEAAEGWRKAQERVLAVEAELVSWERELAAARAAAEQAEAEKRQVAEALVAARSASEALDKAVRKALAKLQRRPGRTARDAAVQGGANGEGEPQPVVQRSDDQEKGSAVTQTDAAQTAAPLPQFEPPVSTASKAAAKLLNWEKGGR